MMTMMSTGNLPHLDSETMQGLITNVPIKRKIRDYVQITQGDQLGYVIYVKQRGILTNEQRKVYVRGKYRRRNGRKAYMKLTVFIPLLSLCKLVSRNKF